MIHTGTLTKVMVSGTIKIIMRHTTKHTATSNQTRICSTCLKTILKCKAMDMMIWLTTGLDKAMEKVAEIYKLLIREIELTALPQTLSQSSPTSQMHQWMHQPSINQWEPIALQILLLITDHLAIPLLFQTSLTTLNLLTRLPIEQMRLRILHSLVTWPWTNLATHQDQWTAQTLVAHKPTRQLCTTIQSHVWSIGLTPIS